MCQPDPRDPVGGRAFSRPYAAKLPEDHTRAIFLAAAAARFIRTYRTRPFALYINMRESHPPYTGPFDELYDPGSIPVSPTFLKSSPENAALMH